MRFKEIITENKSRSCVVVDVQPEYYRKSDNTQKKIFLKVIKFINQQTGPVLMFVNAEGQGLTYDKITDIKYWWEDNGFDSSNWSRVQIVDKGYGYFRSWMDTGTSEKAIIKVVREMYQQKVSDSRDLFQKTDIDYEDGIKSLVGDELRPTHLHDPLIVNWTSLSQLKKFSGSYIMGGARNECLREVELLMNAFNIKYKRIDSLVYG